MKRNIFKYVITLYASLFITFVALNDSFAQTETRLTVRVLSKDAKFIGTGMGGAMIRIVDLRSGKTLAEGVTEGETGNTDLLVVQPENRYGSLTAEGDAKYSAVLKISEPTKLQVIASAPLQSPDNMITISDELWMIPGKHMDGDGFIMEMPGLSVSIQEPLQYLADKDRLEVRAKVIMLCGCPTEPDGLWDSSEMQIEAWVYRNGKRVIEADLNYTGANSTYSTEINLQEKGDYQIYVFAFDPRNSNTGVDTVIVTY